MSDFLTLKIVSPEGTIFEKGEVKSVTIPSAEGEITILPHHLSLVSQVIPGEIIVRTNSGEDSLITTKGFLKINQQGKILILADYAIRSADIEIAKVQEAKKKAEETMREKSSERDFALAEAELRRTLLELKVAQKRRQIKT